MTPVVSGIGWVDADGPARGRTADAHPLAGFERYDGPLPKVKRKDLFPVPYRDFGRMDDYSRVGLAAIALALKDAGVDEWIEKRPIGLLAATVYGCLHTDIAYYRTVMPHQGTQASPTLFTYTLPNCFLGDAAIRFGLTGPAFVVSEPAGPGLLSLEMALECLYAGEAGQMLWGICDLGRPALLSGLKSMPPGALFFLLEAAMPADRSVYGHIELDGRSNVWFGTHRIQDPVDLATACLAGKVPSSGPQEDQDNRNA